MHLLVVGANGLLGSNVVQTALDHGWTVSGTYYSTSPDFDIPLTQLDITDMDTASEIIESHDPDWVVNCAAMTDVDGCEEAPERAHAINARAPGKIASYCDESCRNFLHVSTDYVFDGESSKPYSENATVNPIQAYGKSKFYGEMAVREAMSAALIIRLSFVYGVHRGTGELTGFPAWVRDQLAAGDETPLFTDQYVTPSRAGQTAETVCELLDAEAQGTFNVACQSCMSPYEFGEAICDEMDGDETLLVEGKQSDVDRPAMRPSHTCLDVTTVEETLGRDQLTLAADLDAISGWFAADSSVR